MGTICCKFVLMQELCITHTALNLNMPAPKRVALVWLQRGGSCTARWMRRSLINGLVCSFICSCILQTRTDHLLYARPCPRHREHRKERSPWGPLPQILGISTQKISARWGRVKGMVTSTWKFRKSFLDKVYGSSHSKWVALGCLLGILKKQSRSSVRVWTVVWGVDQWPDADSASLLAMWSSERTLSSLSFSFHL